MSQLSLRLRNSRTCTVELRLEPWGEACELESGAVVDVLADGQLIELFPDWPGERFPLYALYPSSHRPPARVRAFINFALQAVLRSEPPHDPR